MYTGLDVKMITAIRELDDELWEIGLESAEVKREQRRIMGTTQDKKTKILEMLAQGKHYKEIQKSLKVCAAQIVAVKQEYGIKVKNSQRLRRCA